MHVNKYMAYHASSHSHSRCINVTIAHVQKSIISHGLVAVIEDQLQFSGVYRRATSLLIRVTILMRSAGSIKVEKRKGR